MLVLHGGDNPLPVHVGNWRTDNKAKWCGDDPDCDFGNVAKDKEKAHILKSTSLTSHSKYDRTLTLQNSCQAYADPSPLAIINDNYKEGQLNPFPGPKNFGPDSPMIWLDAEADDLGLGNLG